MLLLKNLSTRKSPNNKWILSFIYQPLDFLFSFIYVSFFFGVRLHLTSLDFDVVPSIVILCCCGHHSCLRQCFGNTDSLY